MGRKVKEREKEIEKKEKKEKGGSLVRLSSFQRIEKERTAGPIKYVGRHECGKLLKTEEKNSRNTHGAA